MDDFDRWYTQQRPLVLAACYALVGDLHLAEDAADEAFTRALERWAKVRTMEAPGGWTQTVALNLLRRKLRGRLIRPLAHRDSPESNQPELPDMELWAAVRALSPRQQLTVILRYVHDLSYDEIAADMGVSPGTVAATLHSAHAHLGTRLAAKTSEDTKA